MYIYYFMHEKMKKKRKKTKKLSRNTPEREMVECRKHGKK